MREFGGPVVPDDFSRPLPVAVAGSSLARALLSLLGWQVRMQGLPGRQGVIVVYPHTSNWDFFILVLTKWAVGLPIRFWGKDSLFAIPLAGRWLRWVGGVPVKRDSPMGVVGAMVQTLEHSREAGTFFWLALAPEGTRKRTPGWRSGFYLVAWGADVPVGICSLNYAQKTVDVSHFYQLTGDVRADMQRLGSALTQAAGKHPELASPIELIQRHEPKH